MPSLIVCFFLSLTLPPRILTVVTVFFDEKKKYKKINQNGNGWCTCQLIDLIQSIAKKMHPFSLTSLSASAGVLRVV